MIYFCSEHDKWEIKLVKNDGDEDHDLEKDKSYTLWESAEARAKEIQEKNPWAKIFWVNKGGKVKYLRGKSISRLEDISKHMKNIENLLLQDVDKFDIEKADIIVNDLRALRERMARIRDHLESGSSFHPPYK